MEIFVTISYHYQGTTVPTALFVHDQMLAYIRAGHKVRALVTIPWGKKDDYGRRFGPAVWREDVDGIEHIFMRHFSFSKYGIYGLNNFCCRLALRRHMNKIVKGLSPDVVHGHSIGSAGVGELLRERLGCPLVVTNHGESRCDEPWKSHPDRIAPMVNKADVLICVSSSLMQQINTLGATVRTGVVLNGVRIQNIIPPKDKPPFSLIQVGYVIARKKADITIQALAKLRKCYPNATLDIVGSGPEQERFQTLCRELDIEDAVHFYGYLPNSEAFVKMAKTRFFVMPSINEGFGIVYTEAMTSGCITIGTEGEGIADLIINGENGFLVPPDDPEAIVKIITWCVEHPEEADKIAERGRRDALELTWDKNAAQYISLFEELNM